MRLQLAAAIFVLMGVPSSLAAQDWSVHVTPQLGHYISDKPLGVGTPDGVSIRMAPSTTLGLSLDFSTGSWWALRLSGLTSFGGRLEHALSVTETDCGANCASYASVYERTGELGNLLILGLQGMISPAPSTWALQPYVLAGLGITRYELPSTFYRGAPQGYEYGGREASMAAQVGLGVRLDVGPGSITLEAIDNISGFVGATVPSRTIASQIFEPVRHDLTFGVGYRLRVF